MKQSSWHPLTTIAAFVVCLAATPAVFAEKYVRLYTGKPLPPNDVAFLVQTDGAKLQEINGVSVFEGFWSRKIDGGEILPGTYDLCIGYSREYTSAQGSSGQYAHCSVVRATLLGGHVYACLPEFAHNDYFRPMLEDITTQERSQGARFERSLKEIEEYFRGSRREFKHANAIVEARARLTKISSHVSSAWEDLDVGKVIKLVLSDKELVAVVDKVRDDGLIYFQIGDEDNTYLARREHIQALVILANSIAQYLAAQPQTSIK